MKRMSSLASVLTLSVAAAVLIGPVPAAHATIITIPKAVNGERVELTLRTAVQRLRLATENRPAMRALLLPAKLEGA